MPPLHERYQELECVVDLSLEEDLLIRRLVGLHVVEDALEALVGLLLVLDLASLDVADLLEHVGVVGDEVAHLHESIHDADAYLDGGLAAQDRREHGHALLCEDAGWIAPPAATLLV